MRKFQLNIPEPCQEDWNNMDISGLGRYCQSCKKEVIDFTGMTDQQILNNIKPGGNYCGRLGEEQLGRNLGDNRRDNLLLRHAWKFILPSFFFSKGVIAQGTVKKIEKNNVTIPTKTSTFHRTMGMMQPLAIVYEKKYILVGLISDSISGGPIDAKIFIDSKSVACDNSGKFNFSGKTTNPIISLEIVAMGYEKKIMAISIPVSGFEMDVDVKLAPSFKILKPINILSTGSSRLIGRVGGISYSRVRKASKNDTILQKIQNILIPNHCKVYPNPVPRGGTFEVEASIVHPGNYFLQVSDISGTERISKVLNVSTKKITTSFTCHESMPAGTYLISISDSNHKVIQTGKLIVL